MVMSRQLGANVVCRPRKQAAISPQQGGTAHRVVGPIPTKFTRLRNPPDEIRAGSDRSPLCADIPRTKAAPNMGGTFEKGGGRASYGSSTASSPQAGQQPAASWQMTDRHIERLRTGARKQRFASHTARFRGDAEYRQNCKANGTPEWLQHINGAWARLDGHDGWWRET